MAATYFILAIVVSVATSEGVLAANKLETPSHKLAAPGGLLIDLLSAPEDAVITQPVPRMCWIVNDSSRGAVQSAYQVVVSASREAAIRRDGDVWDSGKVDLDQSVSVPYGGKPLVANRDYWWSVRTWDAEGLASPVSAPQAFHTGQFDATRAWPGESRRVVLRDAAGRERYAWEDRPTSAYRDFPPESVVRNAAGQYLIDFGQSRPATISLTVTSPGDDRLVRVEIGDRKIGDSIDRAPFGTLTYHSDSVRLEKGTHTYVVQLPRHVPHMVHSQRMPADLPEVLFFRYAEISDSPSGITADNVRQHALLFPFNEQASSLSGSLPPLDRVYDLCRHTIEMTPYLSLYLDGQRERMPYEADAYLEQLGHYAVDREYAVQRYSTRFLIYNATWPTEWIMHSVLMAHADYVQTGDTDLLSACWQDLRRKTLMDLAGDDGLISTRTGNATPQFLRSIHLIGKLRDIVDWPPGETDGYIFRPYNTVVNAFHYRALVLMAELADARHKEDEAAFFHQRAAQVRRAFNRKFFDSKRGIYVDGDGTDHASLHASAFALAFGLVEPEHRDTVVAWIKSRKMACSPYAAYYLLAGLFDAGESQYAIDLLASQGERSWLHMLDVGATLTTESWDVKFKKNLSWSHAWAASPAALLPTKLLGIEPLEPTFKRIRIRPQPGNLSRASAKLPTIRGSVTVEYANDRSAAAYHIIVPANASARVILPVAGHDSVYEGGQAADRAAGVRSVRRSGNMSELEIGSGDYRFEVR